MAPDNTAEENNSGELPHVGAVGEWFALVCSVAF
jgi:hypothetical protein